MKKTLRSLVIACGVMLTTLSSFAQDEGFIYGKIYTDDDHTYEGPIRWGKEEVYWIDVFNASKEDNPFIHYLSHDEREALDEKRMWGHGDFSASSAWRWIGIGSVSSRSYENDYTHQFSCQFGEIRSLRVLSSKRVEVELQSGIKVEVKGEGYNDIGADLKILDKEIGEIAVEWNRVERIEFKATPAKLTQKFGEPLYGTVESYGNSYTGYIQWDHDERLTTDKLDGSSEDGKISLLFDKIASLEGHMSRCGVVLKSGRTLELRGSNDVNSENRGIIITDDKGMIVDVPWDEFKRLTFKAAPSPSFKYTDFKSQRALKATVTTSDGRTLTGAIVLDLDEEYDFELFQGKYSDILFAMPLRNIKRIVPLHGDGADIYLANETKLTLREGQDVGELNQGVLVFKEKDKPVYIRWDEVKEIQFI